MSTLTSTLRDALRMVRANPDSIRMIDAEAEAIRADAAAEAKLHTTLAERVEKGIAARTEALIADYLALEAEAIRAAAEALARDQLESEFGITSREERAMYPTPARLARSRVESRRARLAESAPIPWDRQARSADKLRADNARDASRELHPEATPPHLAAAEAAKVAAKRSAEQEQRRSAHVATRKAEARKAGVVK